jgi:hypothetical protein
MKNKVTYLFVNITPYASVDYSELLNEQNKKAVWCTQKLNNLGVFPVYWISAESNCYGFSTDMSISDDLKCVLYLNGVEVREQVQS